LDEHKDQERTRDSELQEIVTAVSTYLAAGEAGLPVRRAIIGQKIELRSPRKREEGK